MWSECKDPMPDEKGREGREVVVVDERVPTEVPAIASLTVNKSSRVHIGTKNINVTQNVHNNDVIKGRLLCLELVSPHKARRLRCSVAVFVCWALVVASGLAFYLIYFTLNKQTRLDLGINETWYLRRGDWQAMPEYKLQFLNLPIKIVIISHSATPYCNQKFTCINQVMEIQLNHLRRGFEDIGPNFVVSGNGFVFEGRGANVMGAMVQYWNSKIISIMFLGDYRTDKVDQEQINHVTVLLEALVQHQVLDPDYILYGYCQIATLNISPGRNIMDKLHDFSHWNSVNLTLCL